MAQSTPIRQTVTIEDFRGKLRLRLPRSVGKYSIEDSMRRICTRLDSDNPDNWRKAQLVALQIEDDLRTDSFDISRQS